MNKIFCLIFIGFITSLSANWSCGNDGERHRTVLNYVIDCYLHPNEDDFFDQLDPEVYLMHYSDSQLRIANGRHEVFNFYQNEIFGLITNIVFESFTIRSEGDFVILDFYGTSDRFKIHEHAVFKVNLNDKHQWKIFEIVSCFTKNTAENLPEINTEEIIDP